MRKKVLCIVGPTAVGKTAVALKFAEHHDCEIVSADSRQIYKYMTIGTAKPTEMELASVPHHFIDTKLPDENYSAGQFGTEARTAIDDVFKRGKLPVVVGGSGLYIRGLIDGFSGERIADDQVKNRLKAEVENVGLPSLYNRLKQFDPVTADKLPQGDTQRILRALEVYEVSGKLFSDFVEKEPTPASFESVFIGLTMPRPNLYERIESRVDVMLEAGLVAEVEKLQDLGYSPKLNALQTVGYKEVFQFLGDEIDARQMASLIKQKTRNFAKRQFTWFKKDKRIKWIDLVEKPVDKIVRELLSNF